MIAEDETILCENSLVVFNPWGFNTGHERRSVKAILKRIVERQGSIGPIRIAFGFRVPGAEIDVFAATRRLIFIAEMKHWQGQILGRMNGPWDLRSESGVRQLSGENPYQQVVRQRSRVGNSLEQFSRDYRDSSNGALLEAGKAKKLKRIADVISAGLVQSPRLNADLYVEEPWWFASGLDDFTDKVIQTAGEDGPIRLLAIESWLARLGCRREPDLGRLLEELDQEKGIDAAESQQSGIDARNRLSPATELAKRSKLGDLEQIARPAEIAFVGRPSHRGLPALKLDKSIQAILETQSIELAQKSFDRGLLVRAGPGAGKTRFLARRAIAACRSCHGTVAVISYTNTARNSVRDQFEKLAVRILGTEEQLPKPFFGTIHQFALWIMTNDGQDISERVRVLNERQAEATYHEVVGVGQNYAEFVRLVNKEGETGLATALKKNDFDVAKAWAQFTKKLSERGETSFETMLATARRAVDAGETARPLPTIMLVDEYQDVTGLQDELICALHARGVHITVVGDREQSIFSFAGADPKRFDRFLEDFAPADCGNLDGNWRSVPAIVQCGNRLRKDDLNQQCVCWDENRIGPKLMVLEFESERREADWISGEIQRLANIDSLESLLNYRDIVILVRETGTRRLERALDRRRIPWRRLGERIATTAVVDRLLAFVDCLSHDISTSDIRALVEVWPGGGAKASAVFSWPLRSSIDEITDSRYLIDKRILQCLGELSRIRKRGAEDRMDGENLVRNSYRVVRSMLTAVELSEQSRHDSDAASICRAASNYHAKWSEGPGGGWCAARSFARDIRNNGIVQPAIDLDTVAVATIHAAKGGEWEMAFIPFLQDGVFPHRRSIDLDEERRLLHVAVTRAKRRCVLSWCPESPGRGRGPSPFIKLLEKSGVPIKKHFAENPREIA